MSDLYDHRRKKTMRELALACAAVTGVLPRRSPRELLTLVQAAGLAPEDVAASFWRNVRRDWLDGEQDAAPFDAESANAEYGYLAELRGLIGRCLGCGRAARAGSPFCSDDCAALWTRAKRGYFSGPPLNMPAAATDALLASIAGERPACDDEQSLRRYLDGAA